MKVLELFSGIGSPRKALERLGIKHEVVDAVEIDKYAVMSYNAIYGTDFVPQDITEWDKDIEVDLIFHGSPCQDFSLAGKQAGGNEESGTRSSLMWHTVRIVEKLKPKYVIWENVKNVISKKHKPTFDKYLEQMQELGYTNHYQVLNAKDYGIPQNRERVFVVSILGGGEFTFPPKQELQLKLKDLLEDEVDEKYYLKTTRGLVFNESRASWDNSGKGYNSQQDRAYYQDGVSPALSNSNASGDKAQVVLEDKRKIKEYKSYISWEDKKGRINTQDHRAFKEDMYSGTVPAMERGVPNVLIKNATKKGYKEAFDGDGVDLAYPDSKTRRGRVQKQKSNTITTSDNLGVVENLRIRKLTPLEVWRLMGFDDTDFEKAEKVCSNSQLYKQAGNSIVVNVLEAIFKELL